MLHACRCLCTVFAIGLLASIQAVVPSKADEAVKMATTICQNSLNAFMINPRSLSRVLSQQVLALVVQQTGGSGVYPALQTSGKVVNYQIVNPHIDNDKVLGQLFHFKCVTGHQAGNLEWEFKFSPKSQRLEYFSFKPVQTVTQQPSTNASGSAPPQQTAQNVPAAGSPPPANPEPRESPAPTKEEACRMFPGMC